MKIRLITFALILMVSASLAIAQNTENVKTSFGILGGVNFQTFNGKDSNGDKLKNDMLIGYHAGVNISIPVAPEFFFQPGILFSIKGAKIPYSLVSVDFISEKKLSYIELPMNLVYKGLLGSGYVMVGFGPYVGYAITGKATTEEGSVSVEKKVEFTNIVESGDPFFTDYYKALDAGANIFVGYELAGGIFLQLNTQLGMLNIKPDDKRLLGDNSIFKNTGYGLSLGYRF